MLTNSAVIREAADKPDEKEKIKAPELSLTLNSKRKAGMKLGRGKQMSEYTFLAAPEEVINREYLVHNTEHRVIKSNGFPKFSSI